MTLVGVPGGRIDAVYRIILPKLEKCSETGVFTVEDLVSDIRNRTRQCWMVMHEGLNVALILTQIGEDRKRTCHITHVVGINIRKWAHVIEEIETWAIEQGCKRLEFACPANGERLAERHGLIKTHIIVEKDLGR